MNTSSCAYGEDSVLRSVVYYSFLFSIGFVPGLVVGYVLWG